MDIEQQREQGTVAVSKNHESSFFYGWVIAIFGVFAVAVSNGLSIGAIPYFYKAFITDFGWNRTTIGLTGTILLFTRGIAGIFTGQWWDKYGPRRFMVAGAILIGLTLLCGTLMSLPIHLYTMILFLALGLTVTGLGPCIYLGSTWFTTKRGIALGIIGTGTSVGGIFFPPITSRLFVAYGWRTTMVLYAALAIFIFAPMIYLAIKNRPADINVLPDPSSSDWFLRNSVVVKSFLISLGIVGTLFYSPLPTYLKEHYSAKTVQAAITAIGIICFFCFIKFFRSKRHLTPVVSPTDDQHNPYSEVTFRLALKSSYFWILLLGASLCYLVIFGVLQQLILHLQSKQIGFDPIQAAWVISTMSFFSLSGKTLFGYLTDIFHKRITNIVGCVVMLLGTFVLLKLTRENVWFFCVLFGFGYSGITITTKQVLIERFGLKSLGKLLGIIMGAEVFAGGIGTFLIGKLFDMTGSYDLAFKVMAACTLVALVCFTTLLFGKVNSKTQVM